MSNSTESLERENTALSASLSIHYIFMALYGLGIFIGLMGVFASVVAKVKMSSMLITFLFIVIVMFVLHLLAVRGLKKSAVWGYNASRLLGLILLLGFPFGTVLGVILLIQLGKFRFSETGQLAAPENDIV